MTHHNNTTTKSHTVVIDDISATINRLQTENDNLRMQVTYLRSTLEENKFLLDTLKQNPNANYMQVIQIVMQRRNEQTKLQREDQQFQFEQRQAEIQQERNEEIKKRTLEKYPHIQKKFEMQQKDLEKEFEKISKTITTFFDMNSDEFAEYQSFENDVSESPIQYSIDYDPDASFQAFRCLVDSTPFFTISQVSSHFHNNRQTHEEYVIAELRKLINSEINKARTEMNSQIEEYSKVLIDEDRKNTYQAQQSKMKTNEGRS